MDAGASVRVRDHTEAQPRVAQALERGTRAGERHAPEIALAVMRAQSRDQFVARVALHTRAVE